MATECHEALAIPGYELIERLGSGGYGEVWRAEVPGGLQKAVKIVYGRYDQQRANIEMRALERIKAIRHPFLLSLERIEIVDGRLVIVTELAEDSLREVFIRHRENGKPGIPKQEMLGYLSDTAEALDFLCQQHELQHLDVKPENLLLVAGHVKLADFGLVKDIYTTQASMVGGMTPSYASPELFHGKPSSSSDQYSLAILYQEMLTGTLPFSGKTTAELTLEHLNDIPDLDPLDEADRFVISQALSKDPTHRFASCREMVTALRQQNQGGASYETATTTQQQEVQTPEFPESSSEVTRPAAVRTEVFDQSDSSWHRNSDPVLLDSVESQPCEYRAAPSFNGNQSEITPTVIIGLGQSAGMVMRSLREQVSLNFGAEALPLVQTLLIDTDQKSVMSATRQGLPGLALNPEQTLFTPLRRPQDYRTAAPKLLRWLSRRWLYNIPRSLNVEGIRPLGRLALVDHARQLAQRLQMPLRNAVNFEADDELEGALGLPVSQGKVRIYLVGSISGGTAGGAMLDLAFLIRTLMGRLETPDYRLLGIATHVTSREFDQGELARVNALAWINEWNHFSQPGISYPGDEAAGFPAHGPEVTPFDSTYFIDMGDRLDQQTHQQSIESIASYLMIDALTPAQAQLDACRELTTTSAGKPSHALRSFDLKTAPRFDSAEIETYSKYLARCLFETWMASSSSSISASEDTADSSNVKTTGLLVHGIASLVSREHLDAPGISAHCKSALENHLNRDVVELVYKLALDSGYSPESLRIEDAIRIIESLFPLESSSNLFSTDTPLGKLAIELAEKRMSAVQAWIRERANTPSERISIAMRCIQWVHNHLSAETDKLSKLSASVDADFRDCSEPSSAGDSAKAVSIKVRLRLNQIAMHLAQTVIAHVLEGLDGFGHQLDLIHGSLSNLIKDSNAEFSNLPESKSAKTTEDAMFMQSLVNELDSHMQADYFAGYGDFLAAFEDEQSLQQMTLWAIEKASELIEVSPLVRKSMFPAVVRKEDCQSHTSDEPQLGLSEQGGEYCLLQVEPIKDAETPDDHYQHVETKLADQYKIAEAWGLSPTLVGAHSVSSRRDYAQLASRIHSRSDVEWSSVLSSQVAPNNPAPSEPSMPMTTQVIEAS